MTNKPHCFIQAMQQPNETVVGLGSTANSFNAANFN